MRDENGVEELCPHLYFPPSQVRSGLQAQLLAILPQDAPVANMRQIFSHIPAIQAQMNRYFPEKSLAYQQSSREVSPLEPPSAPLAWGGNLVVPQVLMINTGDITGQGTIDSENIVMGSLAGNLSLSSQANRVYQGPNYYEALDRTRTTAQDRLYLFSGRDIRLRGVLTQSGIQTDFQALGHIVDQPLELHHHREWNIDGKYHGTVTEHQILSQGSHHETEGKFRSHAGGNQVLQGVFYKGQTGEITAAQQIYEPQALNYDQRSENLRKDGGFFSPDKHYQTQTIRATGFGSRHEFSAGLTITGDHGVTLTSPAFISPLTTLVAPQGDVKLALATATTQQSHHVSRKSLWWEGMDMHQRRSCRYVPPHLDTRLKIYSVRGVLETTDAYTHQDYEDKVEHIPGTTAIVPRYNTYNFDEISVGGPTALTSALVGTVMALGTWGMGLGASLGGGWATAAAQAGAATAATQTTFALIQHGSDLDKIGKDLTSSRTLRALVSSMATAGVLNKVGVTPGDSFGSHLKYNLARSGVQTASALLIEGQDPHQALETFGRNLAAGALGSYFAHHIGGLKTPADGTRRRLTPSTTNCFMDLRAECLARYLAGIQAAALPQGHWGPWWQRQWWTCCRKRCFGIFTGFTSRTKPAATYVHLRDLSA